MIFWYRRELLTTGLFLSLLIPAPAMAQALYSYLDENGVRVFTNIPPKGHPQDLKVTGVPTPPPAPVFKLPAGKACSSAYDPIIEKYAEQYQINPSLICSMISTESAFNPKAISNKGARGLMQLMPGTASRLGVRDVFDPEDNIRGGSLHMRNLLDQFNNDLALSLAAYNAGENLVQRVQRIPNIKETHDYVRTVTKKYGRKDPTYSAAQPPKPPSTYRWVDRQGVLHLQNTPPVERNDSLTLHLFDSPTTPQ